jgi:large subunit ribosomal protein L1
MLRKLSFRQTPLFRFAKKKKKKKKEKKARKRKPFVMKEAKEILVYDPITAFRLCKLHQVTPQDETIDIFLKLGINPTRSEFNVRGSCYMPKGFGKEIKICFLPGNEQEEEIARDLGIKMICDNAMLNKIGAGNIPFEKLYATELGVGKLKPYARILGPKGLFPNKKVLI